MEFYTYKGQTLLYKGMGNFVLMSHRAMGARDKKKWQKTRGNSKIV